MSLAEGLSILFNFSKNELVKTELFAQVFSWVKRIFDLV